MLLWNKALWLQLFMWLLSANCGDLLEPSMSTLLQNLFMTNVTRKNHQMSIKVAQKWYY